MLFSKHNTYEYIKERLVKGKKTYVFLDEIQNVNEFEKTVDSLIQESLNDKNYDEIKYMLYKNNLPVTYPIIRENFEYM